MSELENEIKSDKEFIEKVADRIYKDTDDWEEAIAEPEWIDRMTEIADRYIERFEVTRKLADKWLQSKQQTQLNDNQKIVLDWLKSNVEQDNASPMLSITLLGTLWESRKFNIKEDIKIDDAYCELDYKQQSEVLEVFSKWAQEEEVRE